jgi:hypothetical protein
MPYLQRFFAAKQSRIPAGNGEQKSSFLHEKVMRVHRAEYRCCQRQQGSGALQARAFLREPQRKRRGWENQPE